jgi:hypothetical protein
VNFARKCRVGQALPGGGLPRLKRAGAARWRPPPIKKSFFLIFSGFFRFELY